MENTKSFLSKGTILTIVILLSFLSFAIITYALSQDGDKTETIKINSMVCSQCVDRLNKAIGSIDGVKNVEVDLKKKQAVVTFDESVTSLDKIENVITATGYDANSKKADKSAFDKLPECCQMKVHNEHDNMKMDGSMDNGCCNKSGNSNSGCMSRGNHKNH